MTDTPLMNACELPVSVSPEAQQAHAMDLGISFDGARFVYREFRYDRLPDAIAYAEQDILLGGRQPATDLARWLPRAVPDAAEQELMRRYGIVFEEWRYKYLDYRYDRLADAVNYASNKGE